MRRTRRPELKLHAASVRSASPVVGRRPATSNAGKSSRPVTRRNTAVPTIRTGPRTSGLVVVSESPRIAWRTALTMRRARREQIYATISVGSSASRTGCQLGGPSNSRVHIWALWIAYGEWEIGNRTSDIGHRTSDIGHRKAGSNRPSRGTFRFPISDFRLPALPVHPVTVGAQFRATGDLVAH